MKAIQVIEPHKIEMVEVEKPKIKRKNDVLVKIRAFGICGSDVGILKGENPFAIYPRIIGHEIAGEVEEIGENVNDLKIGDKVVLEPVEFCGKCYACRQGRYNVCRELEVYGVHRDGGFCEFLVAGEEKWHKVDDSLSFVEACTAEPYTIGEQVAARANIQKDDWVLINGAGPAGLLACNVASNRGAKCIVSEINPYRLNMAKEFGAEYTVNPREEVLKDVIMGLTSNEGVNVLIDSTGVYSVIEETVNYLSPASRFVPLAFGSNNIPIDFKTLNQKEISVMGTRLQNDKFPKVISYLKERKDLIDKFVTHTFPAEEYEKAFEVFMDPKSNSIKVVLTFE